MSGTSPSHQPDGSGSTSLLIAYRWPLTLLLICVLLPLSIIGGSRYLTRSLLPLNIENVNHRFVNELPVFKAITGGNLEVGVGEATEDFQRTDTRYTGFGWIYLGQTTSEIRVPVTYRYHVPLAGHWRLDQTGKVCIVTVPKLEPSLPVAFDTAHMEKHAENGWSRFDKSDQLDQLEQDITPTLAANARDEKHLDAARQKFRPVIADFVRRWLLKEDQWRSDRFTSVIVVFEDEPPPGPSDLPIVNAP